MTASRPALTKGLISELDGLRGVAILLVIVHRYWPRTSASPLAEAAGAGWIGVDLFFVISGFLIAGILIDTRDERGYFKNFYARRALRILPLYYLFIGGVLLAFSGNPEFREHAGSPLWYLFHLGNIPEALLDLDVPYWLAPVWSLAIEEQFYLTFPLLVAIVAPRRLGAVLVAMIVAAPLIRYGTMLAAPERERIQYLFTLCRIDTIAVGCLLAVIVRRVDLVRWRGPLIKIGGGLLGAAAAFALVTGLDRTTPVGRTLGYSVVAIGSMAAVALVVLLRGQRATGVLRLAPLRYLGKLCFGLYLLHRPADTLVTALAARAGISADLWLMPIKLAVAVVLASISWRLLERPMLRLKDRFASARHPVEAVEAVQAVQATPHAPAAAPGGSPLRRALRVLGIGLVVVAVTGCRFSSPFDDGRRDSGGGDAAGDGPRVGDATAEDAPPDDGGVAGATVRYVEGRRHSPITAAVAARLAAIATLVPHEPRVFAKLGDSITASPNFLTCFDGGPVDLGANTSLAPAIAYFLAGDAAGASPFARVSAAAVGGTTTADVLAGDPCALDLELTAIDAQLAVIMFGTNDVRYGRSADAFGADLWTIIDRTIARGVVPILSTIPAISGDPGTDARIPTFNRVIRAIAQGREIPLVDLHLELLPLPNRGLAADGLHPSTAPGGACQLTAVGLQYGYDVRNLLTVEALARAHDAVAGLASDAMAPLRIGSGLAADPVIATLPFVDLADTHDGEPLHTSYTGCGATAAGRAIVYRLELAMPTIIDITVVDRGGTDIDVHVLAGSLDASACVATGDQTVTTTVGPGTVYVVADARTAASDGELLLVIAAR